MILFHKYEYNNILKLQIYQIKPLLKMKNKKHLAQIQKSTAEETSPANSQKKKGRPCNQMQKGGRRESYEKTVFNFCSFRAICPYIHARCSVAAPCAVRPTCLSMPASHGTGPCVPSPPQAAAKQCRPSAWLHNRN